MALGAACVMIATACSSSGGSSAPDSSAVADPNGVLNLPYDLALAEVRWDPTLGVTGGQSFQEMVYGTLLRRQFDGTYTPDLAREVKVLDSSTITVDLFPNQKFTDGNPLNAEALKFTIDRNIAAPNNTTPFRGTDLNGIASVTVNSPTMVTIRLKTPTAGSFYDLLAHEETMPYSPAAVATLNTKPVGAGPYMLKEDVKGSKIVLVKNPDYRLASEIRIPTIQILQVTAAAVVNAINSHSVDFVQASSISVADQTTASGDKADIFGDPNSMGFASVACATTGAGGRALADVKVRQALNYATDKEALSAVLYNGKATAMDQLWLNDSKFADPKLNDSYKRNVAKAKQLLADAGYGSGLTLTWGVSPGPVTTLAELVQAQWKEAGIKLDLVPISNVTVEFFTQRKTDLYGAVGGNSPFWTDKISRNWGAGVFSNTCPPQTANPDFDAKFNALRGLDPTDPKAVQSWKDLQDILIQQAYAVFLLHTPYTVVADQTKIGNLKYWPNQIGQLWPDIHQSFIIKR